MNASSEELWIRRLLDVGRTLTTELDQRVVLDRVLETAREITGARYAALGVLNDQHSELAQFLTSGMDEATHRAIGDLPRGRGVLGELIEHPQPLRLRDVGQHPSSYGFPAGHPVMRSFLGVPIVIRGQVWGNLYLTEKQGDDEFSEQDEEAAVILAASAAIAVELAQSVQADRLRSSLAAADAERRRWARELHDETLQGLGGLRLLLSSALRRGDPERGQEAMREAVAHIEREIENLRAIITELRPAALDELGLRTAIEGLLDRHREQSGFQIDGELALPGPTAGEERLDEDLESIVYRLVQEALTNVAKHARANRVRVAVSESDGELLVEVQDDGAGFDPDAGSQGFGLAGMHERVSLAEGTLSIESGERGTLVRACLPARHRGRAAGPVGRSGSEQAAS
jgi:signal transduction histidine kinase